MPISYNPISTVAARSLFTQSGCGHSASELPYLLLSIFLHPGPSSSITWDRAFIVRCQARAWWWQPSGPRFCVSYSHFCTNPKCFSKSTFKFSFSLFGLCFSVICIIIISVYLGSWPSWKHSNYSKFSFSVSKFIMEIWKIKQFWALSFKNMNLLYHVRKPRINTFYL